MSKEDVSEEVSREVTHARGNGDPSNGPGSSVSIVSMVTSHSHVFKYRNFIKHKQSRTDFRKNL